MIRVDFRRQQQKNLIHWMKSMAYCNAVSHSWTRSQQNTRSPFLVFYVVIIFSVFFLFLRCYAMKLHDVHICIFYSPHHHHHSSLFGMHQCVAPLATNSLHSDLSKASSIASSKVRLCRDRSLFRVAIQDCRGAQLAYSNHSDGHQSESFWRQLSRPLWPRGQTT